MDLDQHLDNLYAADTVVLTRPDTGEERIANLESSDGATAILWVRPTTDRSYDGYWARASITDLRPRW